MRVLLHVEAQTKDPPPLSKSFPWICAAFPSILAAISAFCDTTIMMRSVILLLSALSLSQAFVAGPSSSIFHRQTTRTAIDMAEGSDADSNNEKAPAESSSTTDILNSPAFLRRKADVLKSDITQLQEKLAAAQKLMQDNQAEWKPQIDSLQTEFTAVQQRNNKKANTADDQATSQVARQLLEVLDNFDRAFGVVVPETAAQNEIAQRYERIHEDILNQFHKLGIEEVKTLGTEFDYEIHQAVMQRPSSDYDEGIVCEEYQKGYKIGNTLIRAAMVAVAA
jgi:molecular chaperone GrpE